MRWIGPALAVAAVTSALYSSPVHGQRTAPPVRYDVSFENAVHHEATVTVEFPAVRGPLEVRMSRTSPGRYALHEFAKNVYQVSFEDGEGNILEATRPDLHEWRVTGHNGTVRMRYTLFGDQRDGTYAAIGPDGAMLNAPATFVWARGLENRATHVQFDLPEGWIAATQLVAEGDNLYSAPDLAYFLDSPVLIGDLDVRSWTVAWGDETAQMHFAIDHQASDSELDRYMEWVKAVVLEEVAVYDDIPDFDYGEYTFLASYLPWADSDGMEHRNSTVLTFPGRLPDNGLRVLGTVAHEFFHAWNIERIRPETLEPFDFESANVSFELWFGEGFTSYYDDLAMARARIIDERAFGARMGGLVNTVINSPGRRFRSPVAMSMRAPFVDAAVSVDPQNRGNTFISYYTWGAALGLALDLAIRNDFDGKTLDDVMRAMWETHGKPFEPYTVDDIEHALAVETSTEFAATFFDSYVRGHDIPDYEALLATAGYALGSARPGQVALAFEQLDFGDDGGRVTNYPSVWSPLYAAGVSRDEVISHIDGRSIRSAADLADALDGKQIGATVTAGVTGRLGWRDVDVVLAADPAVAIHVDGGAPQMATDRRAQWLAPRAR